MPKHSVSSSFAILYCLLSLTFIGSTISGQNHSDESSCIVERDKFYEWTHEAQNLLYTQNHPLDCEKAPILLCSTRVNKFQGTGSRLFFLGRCLTEGLNSKRVVVLSNELLSTHDMLSPFRAWSNCSIHDMRINRRKRKSRVKYYYPMDSNSLVKSKEMPAVGALYPHTFADRGYWWWKSQEITYALRPKFETKQALNGKFDKSLKDRIVFQVRRTDKTQGCASFYGSQSGIKCKAEARAPKLVDYMSALRKYGSKVPKTILIVTDDVNIKQEILEVRRNGHLFLDPEPAPRRIPDKDGKGGVYRDRALKDALDILRMSYGNPLVFTYSSGFGALALQIKQVRESYCSNWVSLDWGKREWPPIGTIGEGGIRGVKKNAHVVSRICRIAEWATIAREMKTSYCSVILRKSVASKESKAAIFSFCNCNK